ncbi:MAG: spore cortex biosynthesis protein YabQ [Clostridiales bacterium]|nr:spore cortex biosynthesis protein YabQ [Clostridiales bacterium]
MEVDVTAQALSLAGSLALGAALGVVYDLFRVLRVRAPLPGLGGALDVLFWAVATVTLFVWSVVSGGGVVRIYIALGLLAGCWVYFRLLSRRFLVLAYHLADICALVAHVLLLPVKLLRAAAKKVKKIFENPFHYGQTWYKIESLWKNDTFRRHWT